MQNIKALYIDPRFTAKLADRNGDFVGFVIERSTDKVILTSVVERSSLSGWYELKGEQYPKDKYDLVFGSISIIGTLRGADLEEIENNSNGGNRIPKPPEYKPLKVVN